MADQIVFEDSLQVSSPSYPFTNKKYVHINDSNGGEYNSGQVVFESTSLSNSDGFVNWAESYLHVPLVVSLCSSGIGTGSAWHGADAFHAVALKNGFHQLVHSVQVEYNGQSVTQSAGYCNLLTNFKMLTELSQDEAQLLGPALGFAKDTDYSYEYSNTATADGIVLTNNTSVNEGLANRKLQYCWKTNQNTAASKLTTAAACASSGKNYHESDAPSTTSGRKFWHIMATIRLRDLCNFFDQVPLVKHSQVKVTLNMNLATSTITVGAGPTLTITSANNSLTAGTNPMLLSSSDTSEGSAALAAIGTGSWVMNTSIARVNNGALLANGKTHATLSSCRMYVPIYQLQPESLKAYTIGGTTKTFTYTDFQSYKISSVAAAGSFNQLLTNGISNLKRLVIVPFYVGESGITPLNSPFDSAPGTTTPYLTITDLNVQVGGTNVWSSNKSYSFESFMQELTESGLNGAKVPGVTSGLLSKVDHESAYRFYVINLSRMSPAERMVPKSVMVSGLNTSAVSVDLYCFLEFEKTMKVDTITGLIQ